MIRRCYNPKDRKYHLYGARGITVYEPWQKDFEVFLKYLGLPPSFEHSVDRIDPNGPYGPGNVRWATSQEQSNNRRDQKRYVYRGTRLTLAEWSRELGVGYKTLYDRLTIQGLPVEKAFGTPVERR